MRIHERDAIAELLQSPRARRRWTASRRSGAAVGHGAASVLRCRALGRRLRAQMRDGDSGPSGPARWAGRRRRRWRHAALLIGMPIAVNAVLDDLVNAHVRSLMPTAHLIDVRVHRPHTVNPWFAGHADVSPVVVDFAARGLSSRRRARRTTSIVNARPRGLSARRACHQCIQLGARSRLAPAHYDPQRLSLVVLAYGESSYCAVSDTGWDELNGLMLRDTSAAEAHDAHP